MRLYLRILNTLFWLLLMASCDPGMNGDVKVFNETTDTLEVTVYGYRGDDSSKYKILPNSNKPIIILGGLGNQSEVECCPCFTDSISIKSSLGFIKKEVNNKSNWTIPNKERQKKFGGEDLRCEFIVEQSDL